MALSVIGYVCNSPEVYSRLSLSRRAGSRSTKSREDMDAFSFAVGNL